MWLPYFGSAWLIQQLKISFLCSVTYWKQETASSSMVRLKGDVTNINILTWRIDEYLPRLKVDLLQAKCSRTIQMLDRRETWQSQKVRFSIAVATIGELYCHYNYQYHRFEKLNWLRLYQSAAHSQVIEDATRLPLEVGRWRTSWRLLLASCRCNPYPKARNNGTQRMCLMCICFRSCWVNDLVIQFLCCLKVQARLKWQLKVAIRIATFSYI